MRRKRKQRDTPLFDELFDGEPITAEEAKEEAIARVDRNSPDEWKKAFRRSLEIIAARQQRFNADPIWLQFKADYKEWEKAHPRAAGVVIRKAVKDRVIVPVRGYFQNSERRSCHGRPIQVYQSLIYR